jgi:hypothetical protein
LATGQFLFLVEWAVPTIRISAGAKEFAVVGRTPRYDTPRLTEITGSF